MSRRPWLILLLTSPVVIAAGCGPSQPAATGPKGLFEQHCASCHAQAGEPGGPKAGASKGPNLAGIGAKPNRTPEWLADYIRDPKNRRADAKMPKFEGKLSEVDIRSLADYLAGMK